MKTILVPLDGSVHAEQVLPSVRMLAPILGAGVQLLHVVAELDKYYLLEEPYAPFEANGGSAIQRELASSWERARRNAGDYLATLAAPLLAAGLKVGVEVQRGAAAEAIVQAAEREHVALIAMASHGYSGLKRWALGSVTDKVVHATETPVFIVRGTPRALASHHKLQRILVPLDGSALARQALPFAAELATRAHAELIVLTTIVPEMSEIPIRMPPARDEDMLANARAQLLREVRDSAGPLLSQEISVTPLAVSGFPADVIIDQAAAQRADLIVMATHGYSGLKRWALGSVADKVLHAAQTPLVLVRAEEG
jgi:nucleotide-binding universal stress UspA family protein